MKDTFKIVCIDANGEEERCDPECFTSRKEDKRQGRLLKAFMGVTAGFKGKEVLRVESVGAQRMESLYNLGEDATDAVSFFEMDKFTFEKSASKAQSYDKAKTKFCSSNPFYAMFVDHPDLYGSDDVFLSLKAATDAGKGVDKVGLLVKIDLPPGSVLGNVKREVDPHLGELKTLLQRLPHDAFGIKCLWSKGMQLFKDVSELLCEAGLKSVRKGQAMLQSDPIKADDHFMNALDCHEAIVTVYGQRESASSLWEALKEAGRIRGDARELMNIGLVTYNLFGELPVDVAGADLITGMAASDETINNDKTSGTSLALVSSGATLAKDTYAVAKNDTLALANTVLVDGELITKESDLYRSLEDPGVDVVQMVANEFPDLDESGLSNALIEYKQHYGSRPEEEVAMALKKQVCNEVARQLLAPLLQIQDDDMLSRLLHPGRRGMDVPPAVTAILARLDTFLNFLACKVLFELSGYGYDDYLDRDSLSKDLARKTFRANASTTQAVHGALKALMHRYNRDVAERNETIATLEMTNATLGKEKADVEAANGALWQTRQRPMVEEKVVWSPADVLDALQSGKRPLLLMIVSAAWNGSDHHVSAIFKDPSGREVRVDELSLCLLRAEKYRPLVAEVVGNAYINHPKEFEELDIAARINPKALQVVSIDAPATTPPWMPLGEQKRRGSRTKPLTALLSCTLRCPDGTDVSSCWLSIESLTDADVVHSHQPALEAYVATLDSNDLTRRAIQCAMDRSLAETQSRLDKQAAAEAAEKAKEEERAKAQERRDIQRFLVENRELTLEGSIAITDTSTFQSVRLKGTFVHPTLLTPVPLTLALDNLEGTCFHADAKQLVDTFLANHRAREQEEAAKAEVEARAARLKAEEEVLQREAEVARLRKEKEAREQAEAEKKAHRETVRAKIYDGDAHVDVALHQPAANREEVTLKLSAEGEEFTFTYKDVPRAIFMSYHRADVEACCDKGVSLYHQRAREQEQQRRIDREEQAEKEREAEHQRKLQQEAYALDREKEKDEILRRLDDNEYMPLDTCVVDHSETGTYMQVQHYGTTKLMCIFVDESTNTRFRPIIIEKGQLESCGQDHGQYQEKIKDALEEYRRKHAEMNDKTGKDRKRRRQ